MRKAGGELASPPRSCRSGIKIPRPATSPDISEDPLQSPRSARQGRWRPAKEGASIRLNLRSQLPGHPQNHALAGVRNMGKPVAWTTDCRGIPRNGRHRFQCLCPAGWEDTASQTAASGSSQCVPGLLGLDRGGSVCNPWENRNLKPGFDPDRRTLATGRNTLLGM